MRKIILPVVILIVIITIGLYLKSAGAQRYQELQAADANAIDDVSAEKSLPLFCQLPVAGSDEINEVVFTIDDGPYRNINNDTTDHTGIILDVLRREGVPATFFLLGCQLDTKFVSTGGTYQRYCEWTRRMFADGHIVGIHDYNHIQYFKQSKSQLADSLIYTRMRIKEVSGHDVSSYVRSPGGAISPEVAAYLRENGYKHVFWHINPEPQQHLKPKEILDNIISDLNNSKRGIILMHDRTASAYLADLIKYLKSHNIKVISLSEWEARYGLPETLMAGQKEKF